MTTQKTTCSNAKGNLVTMTEQLNQNQKPTTKQRDW
jgi:hypothetical protein